MMKRVEEKNRDVRLNLAQHVRQHDALRLKAGCDAGCLRSRQRLLDRVSRLVDE
jgi:hypothetical protein